MRNRELVFRIVVVSLLVYSMTAFTAGLVNLRKTRLASEELEGELCRLRSENESLKEELANPPDDKEMERLARERLGMVKPGEKIFIFETDREEPLWGWK